MSSLTLAMRKMQLKRNKPPERLQRYTLDEVARASLIELMGPRRKLNSTIYKASVIHFGSIWICNYAKLVGPFDDVEPFPDADPHVEFDERLSLPRGSERILASIRLSSDGLQYVLLSKPTGDPETDNNIVRQARLWILLDASCTELLQFRQIKISFRASRDGARASFVTYNTMVGETDQIDDPTTVLLPRCLTPVREWAHWFEKDKSILNYLWKARSPPTFDDAGEMPCAIRVPLIIDIPKDRTDTKIVCSVKADVRNWSDKGKEEKSEDKWISWSRDIVIRRQDRE